MDELLCIYLDRLNKLGPMKKMDLNFNLTRRFPELERKQTTRKAIIKGYIKEAYISSNNGKGRPKTIYSITDKGSAELLKNKENEMKI